MEAITSLTYIVRPGESNEELRYSLRTVAENWHGVERVTIVGHAPTWINRDTVEVVPGNRWKIGQPHRNVYDNVLIACTHPGHADDLVVMNDDFFLLRPYVGTPPVTYRGSLAAHIASIPQDGWWRQSLAIAQAWLERHCETCPLLSYELHRPLPVRADDMAAVLLYARECQPRNPPQWRTLYGNYFALDAVKADDQKTRQYRVDAPLPEDATWVSTTDAVWVKAMMAAQIRERFPDPSPYERHPR